MTDQILSKIRHQYLHLLFCMCMHVQVYMYVDVYLGKHLSHYIHNTHVIRPLQKC